MVVVFIFFGIVFLVAVIFLIFILLGARLGKKRANALTTWAASVGMTHEKEDSNKQFLKSLDGFVLAMDDTGNASNLMRGSAGGLETTLFDYFNMAKSNERLVPMLSSGILFENEGWNWPTLHIRPRKNEDNTSHGFHDRFEILGDENPVWLTTQLQACLLQHPTWHVEAAEARLLIYRGGARASVDKLPELLKEGLTIKQQLENAIL